MARHRPEQESSALTFWTKLSERSHSNLYFALMFTDRRRRNAFRDVYRFVRAADDVADAPGEPEVNLAGLRPWRYELDAIFAGSATHPYARRLQRVVGEYGLCREHFDTLLDGLERDVVTPRLTDWDDVRRYCESVASSLARLSMQILGVSGHAERRYATDVGIALQIANILRDIAEDADRGHIYLPRDELRANGVSDEQIVAHQMSPGLAAVCRAQADRARQLISSARAALSPASKRRLLVPEIWADIYLALLDRLESADFDVFAHPPYLHRRKKLALAVRRWAIYTPPGALAVRASRFFPGPHQLW